METIAYNSAAIVTKRIEFCSSKLRSVVLYLLFCNLALLNIVDTLAGMFVSLLFVTNGSWFFSESFCRFSAAMQQVNDIFSQSLSYVRYASMQEQFYVGCIHVNTHHHGILFGGKERGCGQSSSCFH
uniref:G-protein coupled receptors family 1 profile domain-containing protein n=1 Tax=Parascaris equorum TaxID=6256 RepID=A0A914S4C6_PAREQ